MPLIHTLIVGAGPAGLAMAARLRNESLHFEVIEKSNTVAFSWTRHYERLHLHTVKSMSALPYLPFPEYYPQYVSRKQIVDYCLRYAEEFELLPTFNTELAHIEKEGPNWIAVTTKGEEWQCRNIVLATGLNSKVHWPSWPGMEAFKGTLIHSRDYKNPEPFIGHKVLIVGMGNTGAEIALDLADKGVETKISVRNPINIVPRDAFGNPTQLTAMKLQKFPVWIQDLLGNLVQRLTIGNLEKYGIQSAKMAPLKQLRTTGKTPLIDLGTVDLIKQGKIKIKADIESFGSNNVKFRDGSDEVFDSVILATGYRSVVDMLVPGMADQLDRYGNPKSPIGAGEWEGLYFLGFDNFRPGGILGIINSDSELIARQIKYYRTPLKEHFKE